jgi:hypothetical protein
MSDEKTKYDQLLGVFHAKIRENYFETMGDLIGTVSIMNTAPTVSRVELAALASAVILLHVLKVDLETSADYLLESKADIMSMIASFDGLSDTIQKIVIKSNMEDEDVDLTDFLIKNKKKYEA